TQEPFPLLLGPEKESHTIPLPAYRQSRLEQLLDHNNRYHHSECPPLQINLLGNLMCNMLVCVSIDLVMNESTKHSIAPQSYKNVRLRKRDSGCHLPIQ